MFVLQQSSHMGGDETCAYAVIFKEKDKTVKEFMDYILTNKKEEYGYVKVVDKVLTYGNGKLKKDEIPYEKHIVKSASASGGWSRMDYVLTIVETNCIEKNNEVIV